jgi:hypothetical protein
MRGVTAILLGTTLVLASCDMYGVRVQDYFDETTTAPLASNGELCAAGENLLEDNLDHASVFMTGEAHGTADSIRIASMLARYFAESGRATTLLWEIGFAAGFYLDEYITGGDPSLLDGILESSEGTYLFTHEWRDFYQQIRAFNQTRIPAVRIRILGIDIEHQYTRGITLMREALPAAALNSAPEAIRPTVDELVTWSSADADRAADDELSAAISRSLQVESSTWEGYLGPSFDRFEIAALSVRSRFDSYGAGRDGFAVAREAAIEEIFRRADIWHRARIDPAAPFYYGHWGRAHIRRERADGVDWIAGRIESIPGYEASVRTAKLFYRDCRSLRRNPYRVTPLADVPIVLGLLTRSSVGSITLYDLDEDGSPFVHRAELVDSPQAGHVTVDYFRLAILVRDGTAAVPLSGTYPR